MEEEEKFKSFFELLLQNHHCYEIPRIRNRQNNNNNNGNGKDKDNDNDNEWCNLPPQRQKMARKFHEAFQLSNSQLLAQNQTNGNNTNNMCRDPSKTNTNDGSVTKYPTVIQY